MSPWLVHSNYGGDTETPPLLLASRGGAMPTHPIVVDPGRRCFCRHDATSPGPWSNAVHPCLTQYLTHQKSLFLQHKTIAIFFVCVCSICYKNHCFCSTGLSRFFCVFWYHLLQKLLFLQHRTIANFLVLFLIRFAGQNSRGFSNLRF